MEKTVQFASSAKPLIMNGVYNINVSQTLDINCKVEGFEVDDTNLKVAFACDQVSMNKSEVYSVYPPVNSVGDFTCCLPHMVFHRKTFLWEKKLKSTNGVDFSDMPYVALLVVSEKENVEESSTTYSKSKNTSVNVYRPEIDDELIDKDQVCNIVDIPKSLWVDILPYAEDLAYLAHTKGVDLDNKVSDSEVKGEWFSCLIANRYPEALNAGEKNLKHSVYLISLEGFEDYLVLSKEERIIKCKYDYIRMYALYSYVFYVEPDAYDFYSLACNMKAGTLYADMSKSSSEAARNITQLGYIPINHNFREGSRLVSWYRPPFLPGEIPYKEDISYKFCSDQLLNYDPELGMFDITYSAAWQLGRMLALQNTDVAMQILSWRLSNKQKGVKNQTFRMFSHLVSKSLNEDIYAGANIHSLCRNVWHETIKDLHEGCNYLADPTGLKGTKVSAFSKEKARKLLLKKENNAVFSQNDLLEEDEGDL